MEEKMEDKRFQVAFGPMTQEEKDYLIAHGLAKVGENGELYGEPETVVENSGDGSFLQLENTPRRSLRIAMKCKTPLGPLENSPKVNCNLEENSGDGSVMQLENTPRRSHRIAMKCKTPLGPLANSPKVNCILEEKIDEIPIHSSPEISPAASAGEVESQDNKENENESFIEFQELEIKISDATIYQEDVTATPKVFKSITPKVTQSTTPKVLKSNTPKVTQSTTPIRSAHVGCFFSPVQQSSFGLAKVSENGEPETVVENSGDGSFLQLENTPRRSLRIAMKCKTPLGPLANSPKVNCILEEKIDEIPIHSPAASAGEVESEDKKENESFIEKCQELEIKIPDATIYQEDVTVTPKIFKSNSPKVPQITTPIISAHGLAKVDEIGEPEAVVENSGDGSFLQLENACKTPLGPLANSPKVNCILLEEKIDEIPILSPEFSTAASAGEVESEDKKENESFIEKCQELEIKIPDATIYQEDVTASPKKRILKIASKNNTSFFPSPLMLKPNRVAELRIKGMRNEPSPPRPMNLPKGVKAALPTPTSAPKPKKPIRAATPKVFKSITPKVTQSTTPKVLKSNTPKVTQSTTPIRPAHVGCFFSPVQQSSFGMKTTPKNNNSASLASNSKPSTGPRAPISASRGNPSPLVNPQPSFPKQTAIPNRILFNSINSKMVNSPVAKYIYSSPTPAKLEIARPKAINTTEKKKIISKIPQFVSSSKSNENISPTSLTLMQSRKSTGASASQSSTRIPMPMSENIQKKPEKILRPVYYQSGTKTPNPSRLNSIPIIQKHFGMHNESGNCSIVQREEADKKFIPSRLKTPSKITYSYKK